MFKALLNAVQGRTVHPWQEPGSLSQLVKAHLEHARTVRARDHRQTAWNVRHAMVSRGTVPTSGPYAFASLAYVVALHGVSHL